MDRQNLARRALVALTLGPLTLGLIYLGGWFYFLAFAALLTIATIELSQLSRRLGWTLPPWLTIPLVGIMWLIPAPVQKMLFGKELISSQIASFVILLGLLIILCFALWLFEVRKIDNAPGSWFAAIASLVLVGWLGSHFFRLRGLSEDAAAWTALAMLGTWIADSGAYVFGKSIGKHKLAPRLSPNKTVEGYIGGIIIGTGFTVLIGLFLHLPILLILVLGLLVSVVSPLGDLGISLLKRSVGVKDSGNLLPGHGGALDRIDSLVWSVALAYYLVVLTT